MDDVGWLTGADARPWLERAARCGMSLVALTKLLRANLSPARTHLVLELVQLRRDGAIKFERAAEMFFTRRGLEQATDERIAAYKAEIFPAGGLLADFCCGIGGDLLGLARRAEVVGVDRDPVMCLVAEANGRVDGHANLRIQNADVAQLPLGDVTAWHMDPDRRPSGRRTTCVWRHEPAPSVVDQIRRGLPDGAVKLAPAAQLPAHWQEEAELEWIGHHRQCQQLVVWFGRLARHPGQTAATGLTDHAKFVRTVTGTGSVAICPSRQARRYVFEPHSAVLAARLTGVLAAQHNLTALAADLPLLTADHLIADPAMASFEISDIMPIDLKRIKSVLRQRRIGRLEVKKRGVPHDPAVVRRQLSVPGENQATLLLTRVHDRARALLGRRLT